MSKISLHSVAKKSTRLGIMLTSTLFGVSVSFTPFSRLPLKYQIHIKKTSLPVVLYGCETWSLTLREEHRLGVFENRVLRRIFGPKRDEVMGGWREREEHRLRVFEDKVLRRIFGPKRGGVTGE
jgi:hypothetical protein